MHVQDRPWNRVMPVLCIHGSSSVVTGLLIGLYLIGAGAVWMYAVQRKR